MKIKLIGLTLSSIIAISNGRIFFFIYYYIYIYIFNYNTWLK